MKFVVHYIGSYLDNIVAHQQFERHSKLNDYFSPYQRNDWRDILPKITTANAFYNQALNVMVVPIGMLQPPLFWNGSKSMMFGSLGFAIGKKYIANKETKHALHDF